MRLTSILALALGLSLLAAAMSARQQDSASSANPPAPAQSSPAQENAPAEQIPAKPAAPANGQAPVAEEKASESVPTKKADAGPVVGNKKRRPRTAPAPNGSPRRIVVREGGASEPAAQIVPGMPPAEATRQRQNAENLLGSTGDQLQQLAGRTLDAQQQETVGQVRNYMEGARSALKEGDVQRASTLAEKAHLLADDLVKH